MVIQGGRKPYTVHWNDTKLEYGSDRIYEPENTKIRIPGYVLKAYSGASNNSYLDFNGSEGEIVWSVEVANNGIYPIDIVFGGISMDGSTMDILINVISQNDPIVFRQTHPLFTGWKKKRLRPI